MTQITDEQILEYVTANIDTFHQSRLTRLNSLKLDELLSRKNPYLFKSKNIVTVYDLVRSMLDAYLSSQEEELFGVFLEGLAVFIASRTIGGRKSGITGIDLEFEKDNARYVVSIKSGPKWGNSSQVNKMKDHFREAKQVLRQGNLTLNVIAINGCCYGRDSSPDKGDYLKICGQKFWELISNDRSLYTRIIEPLAHNAKQRNDTFLQNYGPVVNRFCVEFTQGYCVDGVINWPKLVALSSATTPLIKRTDKNKKFYINRLPDMAGICDTLRHWGEPGLAERIAVLVAEEDIPPETMASIRGFLLFWSEIESDGGIGLSSSEGLLRAEWNFPDQRKLIMRFPDTDRVMLNVLDAAGKPVRLSRIRDGETPVARDTATKKLVELGWLARFERKQ